MDHDTLRLKYLNYFFNNGHAIVPAAPIIPENDSSTLFNSAGMQPMVPYLLGQSHPMGRRLVNSQPCFRSEDIDEVGDNRHETFFEMLGNWSLGDYFKKDQLTWFFDFLTNEAKLDPNNLFVTVFSGDEKSAIPRDSEAAGIWKDLFKSKNIIAQDIDLGSSENASIMGMQGGRIFYFDAQKNWWSRAGVPANMPAGEPGGPDSEVFYKFPGVEHDPAFGPHCHPNCDCGQFLEIGNSVFMEYQKQVDGSFKKLAQRNIDFGGGLIRILASQANDPDIYKTSLLKPIIDKIAEISDQPYQNEAKISMRIIADHLTAATFMVAQGLEPGNKLQGYILRRLIRRAISQAHQLDIKGNFTRDLALVVIKIHANAYPYLKDNQVNILTILEKEESKFRQTLKTGLNIFNKLIGNDRELSGEDLFNLHQSYGFPVELSLEIAKARSIKINPGAIEEFGKLITHHQELSRKTSAGIFKGGLADSSQIVTQYHTLTHLLNATLREVLGLDIWQKGSNITSERLRFDFTYPAKLTPEEIKLIEEKVNEKIRQNLKVTFENISLEEAKKQGAIGVFGEKYPDIVKVYTISGADGKIYSKEICGGPHIGSTSELSGQFKIVKEESVSSGVRRIKAVLAQKG